jgi:serine phosphatase RsbU (regulator of sigma subunit)
MFSVNNNQLMKKIKSNIKLMLLLIVGMIHSFQLAAQTAIIDSLKKELEQHTTEDTARVNTLVLLCKSYSSDFNNKSRIREYAPKLLMLSQKLNFKKGIAYGYVNLGIADMEKNELNQAITCFYKALEIFKEINDRVGIAMALHRIGLVKNYQGKYPEAIQYMAKAGKIREETGDQIGAGNSYNNIGNTYANLGNYVEALNFFFRSLKLREKTKDSLGISVSYSNIGNILTEQGKLEASLNYHEKALKMVEGKGDGKLEAVIYGNIANIYTTQKKYQKALVYNLKSMKIAEEMQYPEGVTTGCINIGSTYNDQHKPNEALTYYLRALSSSVEMDDKESMIESYNGAGNCYEQKGDYSEALNYYTKALTISKELDFKTGILDAYRNLASMNEKLGNFETALTYNKMYSGLKDKLLNEKSLKQTTELNTRYETDKKEKEILLLTKDQQLKERSLKEQRLVRIGLIIGLGLLLILSFLLFNRYRFKQKANLVLEKQKQEIHLKNIQITDSIDYAKTIQEAILPDDDKLNTFLPEHFIFYKPKAIVSGDFYWVGKKDNKIICAVADCTGHGVPGAFMSLLGHNILENVIQRETSTDPGAILTALNQEIVIRFSNGEEQHTVKHGMDIAIISLDNTLQQLQYAGARNSLYLVREKTLTEIKADRMTTGIVNRDRTAVQYTNHDIAIRKGDMLYLFSDGFADQKGGPDKKKFFYQPFKELLVAIHMLPVEEQKQQLDLAIMKWMGTGEQIDDILVMGIKIQRE